jgi:hypothetical protein
MKAGLLSRVERLEEQAAKKRPGGPVHRVVVQIAESEPEAVRRYQAETGLTIMPDDAVVVRRIIEPTMAGSQ